MRGVALLGFCVALVAATPSFADCDNGGVKAAEGGRVCQAGAVSVCSSGAWLQTVLSCAVQPGGAAEPLVTRAPAAPELVVPELFVHVLNARYLTQGGGTDLTFATRGLCDGKSVCTVSAANLLRYDPARRQNGTFNIGYACVSGLGTRNAEQVVFAKGLSRTLSCRE